MAQIDKINLASINALAELERCGVKWESAGDDEIRLCCPVHEDETPSVNFNVEKNVWKCHAAGCGKSGDVISFLAYLLKVERKTVIADLAQRYDLGVIKIVAPERIEQWHARIWDNDVLRRELYKRAITDDDIRRYRLGFDSGRITIPIEDEGGRVINVRKYLPGAPGPKKMQNLKGYKGTALYPIKQLGFTSVVICGGEMKAVAAARLLNPKGIGAVCVTAGEGAWDPTFTPLFRQKTVYICMDVDPGGRSAAKRVAAQVCWEAQSVRILTLPLDVDRYPKGDINDWIASGGTTNDLLLLLEEAYRYVHETLEDEEQIDKETFDVTLSDSTNTENIGRRIRIDAVVSAMDTTPYLVPKTVAVSCTKDQPNCPYCPVRPKDPEEQSGKVVLTVRGTSMGILNIVDSSARHQREAIREACRIPPCKVATFTVRNNFNVLDTRLTPQIHDSGDNTDHVLQAAYIVSEGRPVELNNEYSLSGRVYASPKNQQAVLIFDDISQSDDSLTSFSPDEKDLAPLLAFRPKKWTVEDIQVLLDKRYNDLAANVTRIFHRPDIHLAVDLLMHSALYFMFDGRQQNGWSNALLIGDSSQGKSETTNRLMEHYGLGIRFDCKNATIAGLLGGVQDMGKRTFISWGVITNNDRRFVALEEIKGASTEVLGGLTDMRSSGIAELVKIERRKAHARTRLLMISNPRSDRPVAAYNFGCEVIPELIGSMEDVRRFDFALIVSSQQIDPKEINRLSTDRPTHEHVFTSSLCRLCILWAWTRQLTEISFENGAEDVTLTSANEMCDQFTEHLPLVDRGTMRFKIARLAIALAALTFSTAPKNPNVILVRRSHVDYIREWLIRIYSDSIFGYGDFTKARKFATTVQDPPVLVRSILGTKHPKDVVNHLLHNDEICLIDLCDWCESDRDLAQKFLSLLVRKHALVRQQRWYKKTAEFIALLKQMQKDGIPDSGGPEETIKEPF